VSTETAELDYIARCAKCGRLAGWSHISNGPKENAKWVAGCIRAGLEIGRATTEQARSEPWGCVDGCPNDPWAKKKRRKS
jgi:hypothetical protein